MTELLWNFVLVFIESVVLCLVLRVVIKWVRMADSIFDNLTPKDVRRFCQKINFNADDGHWLWTAGADEHGYGRFWLRGQMVLPHRLMWYIEYGIDPGNYGVLHQCDTPPCCFPEHLFLGTQQDNASDMSVKGRSTRGERSTSHKLTESQVKDILAQPYRTVTELGRIYGVNHHTISDIRNGKTWGYLTGLSAR